ncbi:MAG: tetratricopeptide repeat protein [Phycisphaerae bacterium]|nr:tetratricopeptide repeat protein [Phycisphaerae bacterium]
MNKRLAEYVARAYDRHSGRGASVPGEHPDDNLWALLADGLISSLERDDLLAHVQQCPDCRRRMAAIVREWDETVEIAGGQTAAGFEDKVEVQDQETESELPGPRIIKLWRRASTYAVAACLLLVVGAGLYFGLRPGPPSDYGLDTTYLVSADAPLTDFGLELSHRGMRGDTEPAITEAEYRSLLGKLEPELAKSEPAVKALALAARLALSARFFHDAAKYGQQWVAAAPRDASAHNAHGLALFHENEFEAALAAFERAIELAPDRVEYRLNAALAADEADQIDRAREHLLQLKKTAPDHPRMRDVDRRLGRPAP